MIATERVGSVGMSNVLNESKKQQVIALGMLGWTLRRIEQETGVRRETVGAYLKAAGIAVRPAGAWGRRAPAKAANEVIADLGNSKPANEVITDFDGGFPLSSRLQPRNRASSVSTCEPYRDAIELGLSRGRNAKAIWQDLVAGGYDGGYQTVQRFVGKLRGVQRSEAFGIIVTAAGE